MSAADCQGYFHMYRLMNQSFPIIIGTLGLLQGNTSMGLELDRGVEDEKTACNKDTGGKKRLQKWTRGVWFCVSGGGHIQMWQPLYQ